MCPVAEEPIRPATDEQLAAWKELGAMGRIFIPADVVDRLAARIEADAATIREREQQIKRCHGILQGLIAEAISETAAVVDAQKELAGVFCPGDCTSECNRKSQEDAVTINALIAQNAAQAEEIERLNQRVFDAHKGMLDRDADAQKWKRESAELRVRCDGYEAIITRTDEQVAVLRARCETLESIIAGVSCNEATIKDCERYCSHGEDKLHAEARAIRARQEQEKHGQA